LFDSLVHQMHNLEKGPEINVTATKEEMMEIFETMYTMRRMEITCVSLHLYVIHDDHKIKLPQKQRAKTTLLFLCGDETTLVCFLNLF
jgi:hypothetical protein